MSFTRNQINLGPVPHIKTNAWVFRCHAKEVVFGVLQTMIPCGLQLLADPDPISENENCCLLHVDVKIVCFFVCLIYYFAIGNIFFLWRGILDGVDGRDIG